MRNENMTAYNEAREALDAVLKRVNAIIALSAEGDDPETADLTEDSCGGSCSDYSEAEMIDGDRETKRKKVKEKFFCRNKSRLASVSICSFFCIFLFEDCFLMKKGISVF